MKIALVANTDWYLFNFRLDLVKSLQRHGHHVVMISPPGEYASVLKESGYQWIGWNVGRKTLSPLSEIKALINLVRIYLKIKPDLVHHSTMKPVLYGSAAAQLTGISNIVNSITGLGYLWLANDPIPRFLRPFVKQLFKLSLGGNRVRMIFENEIDREFFVSEKIITRKRTEVIPGVGVDTERFLPSPELPGKPIILFPARILWDKGVGVLVKAARILHASHDVRIVLAGKPDPGNPTSVDLNTIQEWVKEDLIEYWGWLSDMPKAYRQSHIVVLPSFYEGLPTSLLEAAACGRPIVATDVPGCQSVVQDGVNGFLVPVNDPNSLAIAISKLLIDSELRKRMGEAGRDMILNKFDVRIINNRTMSIYDHLINNPN